jgi:methylenetetrahydrofolate dehydrogenase (NADP+)/methenyltetrahydrofolate cyclohydrolase
MAEILEANGIAARFKERLISGVRPIARPVLAALRVGEDHSAAAYVASQQKTAAELGIEYRLLSFDAGISIESFRSEIERLNNDPAVNGIIVVKPFGVGWPEEKVFSTVAITKDVEGMNPFNLGLLMMGRHSFVSPTVLSVLELLRQPQVNSALGGKGIRGKEVTIVGASLLIGKPLAFMLSNLMATVSLAHVATYETGHLPFYCGNAEILVTAVGKPGLIKGSWIKPGAVVVDVGCGHSGGKICGDVEFEKAKERAALITPVPGGVGKLTTMFLFDNLIKAAQLK